jgi:hypothetical protein
MSDLVWLLLLLLGGVVFSVAWVLLTRRPPYECSPDKAIVSTVKRHSDALPVLAGLLAAGIDADVVEETGGSFLRRVAYRFFVGGYRDRVGGPWCVVVSRDAESNAHACLEALPKSPSRPERADPG